VRPAIKAPVELLEADLKTSYAQDQQLRRPRLAPKRPSVRSSHMGLAPEPSLDPYPAISGVGCSQG
jgi:hypothetical protein